MNKHLTLIACMAMPAMLMAADYYVKPGTKATGLSGASWDEAITMYDIFANETAAKKKDELSKYKHNDVFYLSGGTYINSLIGGNTAGDDVRLYRGYVFVGGCNPADGPVTAIPEYPTATPTIFSGDLNENGIPDAGDMSNLICVRPGLGSGFYDDGRPEVACVFYGIDFTGSYSDADAGDGAGAVFCTQGLIEMHYCNIYGNRSEVQGAGIGIWGGRYHLYDCNIYDNSAKQSGAGMRVSSRASSIARGVIERCYFGNNTVDKRYGGALAFSSGDSHWIVNSTFWGNSCQYEGGAIAANGSNFTEVNKADQPDVRAVNIINSTIAGNICRIASEELYEEGKNPGSWLGSQVRIATDPAVSLCNSIIVGLEDDGTIARAALVVTGTEKTPDKGAYFNSYGGSVLGTFGTVQPDAVIEYDFAADVTDDAAPFTFAAVFGADAKPAKVDGSFTKMLTPKADLLSSRDLYPLYGFETNDFINQLKNTGVKVPYDFDLTVDQAGRKRFSDDEGETMPGAVQFGDASSVRSAARDAAGITAVYNAAGIKVADSADASLAPGMYIVVTDGQATKVIR